MVGEGYELGGIRPEAASQPCYAIWLMAGCGIENFVNNASVQPSQQYHPATLSEEPMKNIISFSIYDKSFEVESFLKTLDGVTYSYKPVEMAFDSDIDAPKMLGLFLEFSSAVGVSLFASWLYDRIKNGNSDTEKADQHVTINGNKISGENITVVQIVNIIDATIDTSDNTK